MERLDITSATKREYANIRSIIFQRQTEISAAGTRNIVFNKRIRMKKKCLIVKWMKRDLGSCQQRLETRHESKDLFQHNIFYGCRNTKSQILKPKRNEFKW